MDWTEKYRPGTWDQLMLGPKLKKEILEWARNWSAKDKVRGAIFHGPPGVGKTSTALVLAKEMGWSVLERNASDARKKEDIRQVITLSSRSATFGSDGSFGDGDQHKLIIMDEADQIHKVRGETSGIKQLIETLKITRHPIILTANDFYNLTKTTGSALRALCKDFKFNAVTRSNRKKFLLSVTKAEKMELEPDAFDYIVDRSAGDLRSALRDLEAVSQLPGPVKKEDLETLGRRDQEVDIFRGIAGIFKSADLAQVSRRRGDLDVDPETLILWVDENLPAEFPHSQLPGPYRSLARGDLFLGRVRRRQSYRFWKHAAVMMTGGVLFSSPGLDHQSRRYNFPSYLRQMGSSRARRGTLRATMRKLGTALGCSGHVVALEVLPLLRSLSGQESEAPEMMLDLALETDEMAFLMGRKATSKEMKLFFKQVAELELERSAEAVVDARPQKASSMVPAQVAEHTSPAQPDAAAAAPEVQPEAEVERADEAGVEEIKVEDEVEDSEAVPTDDPDPAQESEDPAEKKSKQTALFDF